MEDTYWPTPQQPYDERRRLYLEYCAPHAPAGRTGFMSQIARLELGREPVSEEPIREALAYIDQRLDCSDFAVAGLLRILYKYRESPLIAPALIAEIEACLLRFKYWWDEPGEDRMCYWTENHQIMFHADQLLAGQLFRDRIFANTGMTGQQHIERATRQITRWLELRERLGFCEWLSNCYFDEDLLPLANLYDFADDPAIRRRAGQLIDVLLFETALHTFRGVMGCTHGRTYAHQIKGGRAEPIASTTRLMLGLGLFNNPSNLSAVSLATSAYRCPPIFEAIAADTRPELIIRERHSIEVDDAPRYGLRYDDMEDGAYFWSIQTYVHPKVVELSKRMSEAYRIRFYGEYQQFIERYQRQLDQYGQILDWDIDRTALTEVNIETYRTPEYQLSCAQDYRAGKAGYQQHIWQATLGIDAVVFTNHPGSTDELSSSRPNYWAGNGRLPRAAQHRQVLICLHNVPPQDPFPYSHAYFPRSAFDQVVERDHWLFGRKGDGYVALYAQHPARRPTDGPHVDVDLLVDQPANAWICELGNRERWGSFEQFVEAVAASAVAHTDLHTRYHSPSLGVVEFGWEGPLRVDGREVALRGYDRFENPYCRAPFDSRHYSIKHGDRSYELDLS